MVLHAGVYRLIAWVVENGEMPEVKAGSQPTTGSMASGEPPVIETLTRETLSRLLGAVSFGYGLFQLALSMIPDKILKLIEFLGFHGDKVAGLEALGKFIPLKGCSLQLI